MQQTVLGLPLNLPKTEKIVGYEIDLINKLSVLTSITIELLNTGWNGIFAGLKNGAYNAVASEVTVTEERRLLSLPTPY